MGLDLNDYEFESPIGFDGENEYNFYGDEYSEFGIFDKIGKGFKQLGKNISSGVKDFVKNPIKAVGNLAKDTGRNVVKGAKAVGKAVGDVAHKGFQLVNRWVNPLTIAGREGYKFIVRRNGFGLADRIAPLYINDGDARLKKYKPDAVKKIRDSKYNIENAWRNMGGAVNELRDAVLDGQGRPPRVFKKGDKSFDGSETAYSFNFDGSDYNFYGDEMYYFDDEARYTHFDGEVHYESNFTGIEVAGLILSGLSVVATYISVLKSNKVPDNPYQESSPEYNAQNTMPTSAVQIDPNAPILSPDGKQIIDPNTGQTYNTQDVVRENLQTNPDGSPSSSTTDEKFLGMPKKVGIGVAVGVGLLVVGGVVLAIAKKKK